MIFPVLTDLARLLDAITPEQEGLPTPCDEFDVRTLRQHLLGWLDYFQAALADPAGDVRPEPEARVNEGRSEGRLDDSAAVIEKLTATLRAALDDAVATRSVNVPRLGGAYPGSAVIDLLQVEVLGHGWDLARATGLAWQPDPAASAHALTVLQAMVKPEYRGPGLPFGPEVPVPADAPALDRLVAFTGRDPGWAPRGDLPVGSL
ncbi:TIGR03086 family protein [Streptomyces cirratus]|uniref:TIGR03086 family protein n=1 Tax=Streptomyces cirratus TaxID=68187 RepID=A0ABQ3F2W1_9ACTN|nr:TIGR03086 family metal-binding protein [Streptomyces cirratus]GHB75332.1 TIGR03086 family protein [Streptomyces cirratus]